MMDIFASSLEEIYNESDVEQKFLYPFLVHSLKFPTDEIRTKKNIPVLTIGKGKNKRSHQPDYILSVQDRNVVVVEAKHPEKNLDNVAHEPLEYAAALNREVIGDNPVKYCLLSNAKETRLYKWDENQPLAKIGFKPIVNSNRNIDKVSQVIGYKNILDKLRETKKFIDVEDFTFTKPVNQKLKGIFQTCHNVIWSKEHIPPTEAFYEFSKILFVKLNEDKKINIKIEEGQDVTKEDFVFSTHWIDSQKVDKNPINNQLFITLRDSHEERIRKGEMKRIFDEDEEIKVTSNTIKEVVSLLQNFNLYALDEDLNGRVFETFLGAEMRGKELGQFFTPRKVVEFMVKMADLEVSRSHIDKVIDACCGSGGFLIYSMTDMLEKLSNMNQLTPDEYEELKSEILKETLWGIDDTEEVVRIARMNMNIHGDGGSKIYKADSLDKNFVKMSEEKNDELEIQMKELKRHLDELEGEFDVALTNPPFAMKYSHNKSIKKEEKKTLEGQILMKYDVSHLDLSAEGPTSKRLSASVKSNRMFLERYYELLKPGGKLITVIDESVLNTQGRGDKMKKFRSWLLKRFYLKAVISLPRNTFVNAEAAPKTSIIYLEKKGEKNDFQPETFYAISENVGHNDAGKPVDNCDLGEILEAWKEFQSSGH